MENQNQYVDLNNQELQNNLNLALKIIKNGAPAIADEINAAIVNTFNTALARTNEAAELKARVAELEAKFNMPDAEEEKTNPNA